MNQSNDSANESSQGSAAKVAASKKGISTIWFIPLLAAVIGAWLVFTAISEQGAAIKIEFVSGDGIVAGKTEVKYKGIVAGQVETVEIKEDLSGVVVGIRMERNANFVLTDKTRFWVVKPRVTGGQISGLGTLLSGAFIGMDPDPSGKPMREFVGLERPPAVLNNEDGTAYKLQSPTLASLDYGSPIYYRGLKVGRVTNYQMGENDAIIFDVFIQAPYDKKISKNTRFWNAGGVDLELGAEGLRLQTASLSALLVGGVSFDTSESLRERQPVGAGYVFNLFDSERDSKSGQFRLKEYYVLKFDGSLRGLEAGAPVEFRGIRVGTVEELLIKPGKNQIEIPVLIAIEPERYGRDTSNTGQSVNELVRQGLRASLQTGNLLTGKKYVDIEIYPDAEPAEVIMGGTYPQIPTLDSSVEEVVASASGLIKDLRVTASRINDLLETTDNGEREGDLAATLTSIRGVSDQINRELAPNLNATLVQAEKTLANAQSLLANDATTRNEVNRLLIELTETAAAIRGVADYLEQNPQSIIYGKDE